VKTCYTITMVQAYSHGFDFAVYKNGKTLAYGWACDEAAVLHRVAKALEERAPEPQTEEAS